MHSSPATRTYITAKTAAYEIHPSSRWKHLSMGMNHSIFLTISARLFVWLIISASTDVVCQSQSSQHYAASDVWPNYCPVPENATGALLVRSLITCGVKCSLSPRCVDFSFYSSSGRCYLYGALPPRVSYDADCKFMMVWSSSFLSVDHLWQEAIS